MEKEYHVYWNQFCRHCRKRTVFARTTHPGGPLYVQCRKCKTVWKFEGKIRALFHKTVFQYEYSVARLRFKQVYWSPDGWVRPWRRVKI